MPLTLPRTGLLRHWPKSLPRNQDRTEVRILWVGMIAFFMGHLLEPAVYAAGVESSVLFKVVALTGHPHLMLAIFFGCVALMLPHLISLMFMPRLLHCRAPRLIACGGAMAASLLWFYMANMARPLDYGALPYIYAFRAFLDLSVAGVLAFSLNAQQLRERVATE